MANLSAPSVDYAFVLADLRAKKHELQIEYEEKLETLDNAIEGIELIYSPSKTSSKTDLSTMGVYEASCFLLEKEGKPLTSKEVVELLNNAGKKVQYVNVASTLYRSLNEKKDCKIKRIGKGKKGRWDLINRGLADSTT